jgi:hypothetical protein
VSFDVWVSHATDGVGAALRKLGKLPPSDNGKGATVPFPYRDKTNYKSKHPPGAIRDAIRDAPIKRVDLAGLHAIQQSIQTSVVWKYLEDPDAASGRVNARTKTPSDLPIVVQQDGVRYIHDGHHRLTAEKLRGATTARVRFIDFDKTP